MAAFLHKTEPAICVPASKEGTRAVAIINNGGGAGGPPPQAPDAELAGGHEEALQAARLPGRLQHVVEGVLRLHDLHVHVQALHLHGVMLPPQQRLHQSPIRSHSLEHQGSQTCSLRSSTWISKMQETRSTASVTQAVTVPVFHL